MKKLINYLSLLLILTVLGISTVNAETIYTYNGYSYVYLSNGMASICGWDNSAQDFIAPDKVGDTFVIEIGRNGLQKNTFITSVDFSKTTKMNTIGGYAFEGCSSLSGELTLPRRIGFIGDAAFMNCSSLEIVNYLAITDTVPRQCFKNCFALKDVILTNGLKGIDAYAFQNCNLLETILIPKTVSTINSTAFSGCSDFTIKGYMDSYAEQYAKDNGINFEILDPLKGDADGNRVVNINDATAIQKYKAGLSELTSYGLKAADVNGDGSVTVRDATLIQMRIAGIIDEF